MVEVHTHYFLKYYRRSMYLFLSEMKWLRNIQTIYKDNNSGDENSSESPEEIILCSDNKLSSASLTPFIAFLDTKPAGPEMLQFIDSINNEAQRDKEFLDTQFWCINLHLWMAIMKEEIKLSDPKALYDCLVYMGGIRASDVIL